MQHLLKMATAVVENSEGKQQQLLVLIFTIYIYIYIYTSEGPAGESPVALFSRWSTVAREFDPCQLSLSEMIVHLLDIIHGKFQPPTLIRYRDMPCRLDQRVT